MSKLDVLFQEINKKAKAQVAVKGITRVASERIPFTSPRANYILYGGIPRGRIVEFAGEEGGGKTTTALDICANAQKLFQEEYDKEFAELSSLEKPTKTEVDRLNTLKSSGPKKVAYIDHENTLDEDWAITLGVDVSNMYILKPQEETGEEIFQIILDIIETGEVGLVVLDSIGVMMSGQEMDKDMSDPVMVGISKALTRFSKRAVTLCAKYNCTLIGINQIRDNIGGFGINTPGGRAWKHHCSVRLIFTKGSPVDDDGSEVLQKVEDPAGNLVSIRLFKTKISKPNRKNGFYTLNYTRGIDVIPDTLALALKYNYAAQSGSWFNFVDPETGEVLTDDKDEEIKIQGKGNVVAYLREDDITFQELYDKVSSEVVKIM